MSEPAVVVPLAGRPHVLYRMFTDDRQLLYVGITTNLEDRLTDHRGMKAWWRDVMTIELEHFPSRSAVEQAERAAITNEQPIFNVRHGTFPACGLGRHKTRMRMKQRNVRVPDEIWDDAVSTAYSAGESLSERLREFLEWYSRQPGARPPRRPDRAG